MDHPHKRTLTLTLSQRERGPADERRRAVNYYPFSRWYLRPLAGRLAAALTPTSVRPWQLTLCGLLAAASAAGVLVWQPAATGAAAGLVLVYWFFDRADGQLARRQRTASALGAWLDANIDELADIGLHLAVAYAAMADGSAWAAPLLVAFLGGKYLLMYGVFVEQQAVAPGCETASEPRRLGWIRAAYHLPGNADVRVHLLALGLLTGWLTTELALVAVYYNARWIARYGLVVARRGGVRP